MEVPVMTLKYGFRIRTKQGMVIEKLNIQGRTAEDAERKLRKMYPHCEILESSARMPVVPRMFALRAEPSILPGK